MSRRSYLIKGDLLGLMVGMAVLAAIEYPSTRSQWSVTIAVILFVARIVLSIIWDRQAAREDRVEAQRNVFVGQDDPGKVAEEYPIRKAS